MQAYIISGDTAHIASFFINKDGSIRVECPDANIEQDFLSEDIGQLLIDLPNLINEKS